MNFELILPQQIIFGEGTIKQVGEQIERLGGKKALIVTSNGMQKRVFLKCILNEINSIIYPWVEPDPSLETTIECVTFVHKKKADLIIGLGGGSVMDVAKKVATDLGLPKIMIPTTSGSGSEVTHEVVFKIDGKKKGFVDKKLVANVAIVDPDLLKTLPERQVMASTMDALAHSIESHQANRGNSLTQTLAYKAYEIIESVLYFGSERLHNDQISRVCLSHGSLLAGMAFGNSGTTLCHALSYPLSNRGIPHGIAVAIMLPYSTVFNNCKCCKCGRSGNGLGEGLFNNLKKSLIPIHHKIMESFEFEGNIEEMAKEVMEDKRHLSNNPVEVKFEDVVKIYKEALT